MESWRTVWRAGFAPGLPLAGLLSLRDALESDDPRLTQGSNTTPPPLMCVQDWPVEADDAIAWTGWQGGENPDCKTVGQVNEHFARMCFEADQRLGEPAECRWFLNWFDDTPRDEMRRELLAEVERAIDGRRALSKVCPVCRRQYADSTFSVCPDCGERMREEAEAQRAVDEYDAACERGEPWTKLSGMTEDF